MSFLKYLVDFIKFHTTGNTDFIFFVTNRCNARCKHCFYAEMINSTTGELSLHEIKKIAKYLRPYKGGILITGGEPFLRDDLGAIIKILADEKISKITVNSNGIATEKILETVKHLSCLNMIDLQINVSIDGTRQTHDKIRNYHGAFDQTITTIKELQKIGIKVTVLANINALNYTETGAIYRFCTNELGIKPEFEFIRGALVSGIPPHEANSYYNPYEKELLIRKEMVPEVRKALNVFSTNQIKDNPSMLLSVSALLARLEALLDIIERQQNIFKCCAGKKQGVIYENGDVALCEIAKPIGNLRHVNFDIGRLWHNDTANNQRRFIRHCYCTHSCFINVIHSQYFLKKLIGLVLKQLYLTRKTRLT